MVNPVPDRGTLVWLDFDPQAGSEQAGRRPAMVISPLIYNTRSRVIILCPITRKVKGYPFEVLLPPDCPVQGAVIADHIKSMDHRARNITVIARADQSTVEAVLKKVAPLIT